MDQLFSIENPLMRAYTFYNSILCLKMLAMSVLTASQRMKNKAFANPEDAIMQKTKPKVDENVERVRRAHLNDLENICVYFVASFGYLLTNPSVAVATMLFRVFTICRIAHTLVYAVVVIPQPARAIAWGVPYFITIYMAIKTAMHFAL
ncbi:PREDICTED: microsomal glutathione S-transferase 1-like [Nicrophorus vespilloides]|uniref:Microsomal glutathione S-transferase 1 n=1 Tax=Nicrophorus vespilloides TaxID=110193 RepID=A0ABM1N4A1_NICVS|nr:PREDICTED: microsomal glutathione S-transferase 1-like [Nicrophorus vespilloides]